MYHIHFPLIILFLMEGLSDLRVCNLMADNRSGWNLEMLEATFDRVDVNRIRTVPLSILEVHEERYLYYTVWLL